MNLSTVVLASLVVVVQGGRYTDDISHTLFLKRFLLGLSDQRPIARQDLKIIGAGFGRTGTSSFITAIDRLGLKSYHMSGVVGTAGHVEMWADYAEHGGEIDDLIDSIAEAGFNATSSMPACLIHDRLMERYPSAKVIMTVRGDGDGYAWAKSVQNTIGKLDGLFSRPPFKYVTRMKRMSKMIAWIFATIGAPIDPETLSLSTDDLAAAYDRWVAHVKATVPEDRLLVFAAQDGWSKLCGFVSDLDPAIESECAAILASGEPYPRVNEAARMQHMYRMLNAVAVVFETAKYWLSALVLVWWMRRRRQPPANKKKAA